MFTCIIPSDVVVARLRFAAGEASVNVVLAIASRDGVARCVIAEKRIAHASRATAKLWRFVADVVTAFAVAVIVMKKTIFDIPAGIAKSVP